MNIKTVLQTLKEENIISIESTRSGLRIKTIYPEAINKIFEYLNHDNEKFFTYRGMLDSRCKCGEHFLFIFNIDKIRKDILNFLNGKEYDYGYKCKYITNRSSIMKKVIQRLPEFEFEKSQYSDEYKIRDLNKKKERELVEECKRERAIKIINKL